MITAVPDLEPQEGEGYDSILRQLAQASTLDDLNAPWRSQDAEQLLELALTITGIKKAPSTYGGGLAWFLVVDAYREDTGELVTFTTGSINIVGQLVKAWSLGGLPCRARIVQAKTPTRNGNYPQHLEFLPRAQAATVGNGAQG
jgi:hypothetical protein